MYLFCEWGLEYTAMVEESGQNNTSIGLQTFFHRGCRWIVLLIKTRLIFFKLGPWMHNSLI
jgi:hypothetical protein